MSWLTTVTNKLKHWSGRSQFDHSLDEELRLHIEERTDELVAGGLTRAAAKTQAHRELGSAARIAEESREAWRWTFLEDFLRDLRYAARTLARDRGFVATAVLSLALGVGVNTTLFNVTKEFLFSQPTVEDPATLVVLRLGSSDSIALRDYRFVRDSGVFRGLTGINPMQEANWRTTESSRRIFVMRVTDNFFNVTGTPVAMGRALATGELDSVVLTHNFWQRHLNGDPSILGKPLVLDGRTYTIAGVLPRLHRSLLGFGYMPDVYLPFNTVRGGVQMYARLSDGSRAEALARLMPIASELDRIYPDGENLRTRRVALLSLTGIERLTEGFLPTVSAFFGLLMAVAGLLLLIACANVASLLLARASARQHELSVRLSIGASRGRLVRQLLAESLLLALMATTAGLALSYALSQALSRVSVAAPFPIKLQLEPDGRLLLYALCLAVGIAILSGLAPALHGTRSGPGFLLKRGEFQAGRRGAVNFRNALISGQIAVSVIVLVLAALSLRNLFEATRLDPGFDLKRTVWAQFRLVPESYPKVELIRSVVSTALGRLQNVAGVESATVATFVPLNDHFASRTQVVYTDHLPDGRRVEHSWNAIGPDYLKTMGIPVIAGREFEASDRDGAVRGLIVNEAFAKIAFGAADALGRVVRFGNRDKDSERTVIGVARNSKYSTVGEKDRPAVYEAYYQAGGGRAAINFLVRVSGPPAGSLQAIDRTLLSLDGSASSELKPMSDAMAFALMPSRFGAGMLGAFGVIGLALAAVGLYGVLAYSIGRRTREIGLRMALGAQRSLVVGLVLSEGAKVLGIGVAIGGVIAILISRPLARFLVPAVQPTDPAAFAAVVAVLVTAGLAASLRPALRAISIDPISALREE